MKAVLVILVTLLIFIACATLGYSFAGRSGMLPEPPQPTEYVEAAGSEQHNLIVIQVDQLDAKEPRLVSVWFISLFFWEDAQPRLAFVQLYSPQSSKAVSRNLERNFKMDSSLEPTAGFWRSVKAFKIDWEAFFVVDDFSTQRILEWVNGPGDYVAPFNDMQQTQSLINQTCQSLQGISSRESPPFDWTGLAPDHFHSNMRMEIAMAYWNKLIQPVFPVRCELILSN